MLASKRIVRSFRFFIGALVLALPLWHGAASAAPVPVIFVHGAAGSGAQYMSHQMRWTSNGYPQNYIRTFEYNSEELSPSSHVPALDAFIDSVRSELGAPKVYLVGHSLGTFISNSYLGSSTRAAKVAKYIGIDGATSSSCPGGVPCMGIWGSGSSFRRLGSNNVRYSSQTHVEVCTSPQSFGSQYQFLIGTAAPSGTRIAAEATTQVSGRAVNFPANAGASGATLRIWTIDQSTGARTSTSPLATFSIGSSGAWGPVSLSGSQRYEFEVARSGLQTSHIYTQPIIRSTNLMRLNLSPAGSGILANTVVSDRHSAMVISRYREFHSGQWRNNDRLNITTYNGSTNGPHNVLAEVRTTGVIGIHVHDNGTAGYSSLDEIDYFADLPFQTGVDVYMPAANPPSGRIVVANAPRGDTTRMQTITVANWPSSSHRISVEFNDYVQ